MTTDADRRAAVDRYFTYSKDEMDLAHEMYHEDAVLEFPQSGERFEGVANFKEWRTQYPANVEYQMRRLTSGGNEVIAEVWIRYDRGPWLLGIGLFEFRGDKVAHERIYVMEQWEAPDWRARWRSTTPADPPIQ